MCNISRINCKEEKSEIHDPRTFCGSSCELWNVIAAEAESDGVILGTFN